MSLRRTGGDGWSGRPLIVTLCLPLAAAALCLGGCDKKKTAAESPTAASTPVATPEPGYAGVPETSAPSAPSTPAAADSQPEAPVGTVEAPAQVNMSTESAENQQVKSEVLARIDVMPKLTPEEKDKLYVMVDRARGMGKIITIPFSSGKVSIGAAETAALQEKVALPQIKKYSDDPTVVFVVLGYADKKGDAKKNEAISFDRAESVVNTLKNKIGVLNVVHAVGMGGSEMFDAQKLEKNRVVEVWAVLP